MTPSSQTVLGRYSTAEQERMVREGFLAKMLRFGKKLPFAREAVASFHAMQDPKVPLGVRIAVVAPLAYFVIPTDMIPDFLLGLGFTDDALVFWAAWRSFRKHVTPVHYAKADEALGKTQGAPEDAPCV
ncbi:YkvA family protein [Maritimibacter sp. DP1N21-5]|uniref:YkvA family protein n=1 Tax=Maritimibacter sp. DP1N21-5 TaxID=2836867 RepID=UPI001C46C41A|nr:YkvA family protein [Maritimibacter sp. DP1N21-5]MBV7409279.1 DUF1232 domain-containing protein [Maritimibacter sp. DP1N21-5]